MSRTDVHRPPDVQTADPYNRHLLYRFARWPWAAELVPWKNIYCGCHLCTGRIWRRQANSRERVRWRNVRADLLKTAPADRDAMDVPPLTPDW